MISPRGETVVVERATSETSVRVALSIEAGEVKVSTGVPFFDHMLDQLGRHARLSMEIHAAGDLDVDAHHTVEDVGLVLGEALVASLGDKRGIRRYGDALVPMEEALAQVAVDVSGRPLLVYEADFLQGSIGQYDTVLTEEFLQALCRSAGLTMHVRLLAGRNAHHAVEAIFKAVAVALGEAVSAHERAAGDVPSTKGLL
ncbi:MAG: imidazoleglycerol-phosphate dehydratase HisB [Actinomycetota bacterium]